MSDRGREIQEEVNKYAKELIHSYGGGDRYMKDPVVHRLVKECVRNYERFLIEKHDNRTEEEKRRAAEWKEYEMNAAIAHLKQHGMLPAEDSDE